jgi:hypothetical protein
MHPETPTPTGANYRLYSAQLCRELPEIPDEDPQARAARQKSAMDAVVALHPDNAFEAELAVRIVSTGAHAGAALREAALAASAGDAAQVRQCRAQAASMARVSDAALRSLLRIQARREKQEAEMHPAFMGRAGYWFKEVSVPGPDRDPGPAPTVPPPPAETEPEPVRDLEAEADMYAIMYPDRAARIRAAGGLPASIDFGPPEPELVEAIIRGASPILQAAGHVPQNATVSPEPALRDNAEISPPGAAACAAAP